MQAARAGYRVALVEEELGVGGACVHRGTIPSKTLRETALALTNFRRRSGNVFQVYVREDLQVESLMVRRQSVADAHARVIRTRLERDGVDVLHGRARFVSDVEIEVVSVDRTQRRIRGRFIVIATGSKPRKPPEIPVDHDSILDSDSILSMIYLPRSLTVLGSGVIACEYASIFAALGVRVTIIDKHSRPLGFLDPQITTRFVAAFCEMGGEFIGDVEMRSVAWDGLSSVVTTLADGREILSEKLLCCLGRVANLESLELAAAGLAPNGRGVIAVDEYGRTQVAHIYAVGDVAGPPALAATSLNQGRRAIAHALGLELPSSPELVPVGVYTIPEMSYVGLSESDARRIHGDVMIGEAGFDQIARGWIAAITSGQLRLIADVEGRRLLGVQVVGEGAADLVHLGQMALRNQDDVDVFVDNTFNFPTLAEAYRIAALEIVERRPRRPTHDPVRDVLRQGVPIESGAP